MATIFADKGGRKWTPEVDVVTIGRVRAAVNVNLLELLLPNNDLAQRLEDPCLLVDILYLLCKDAADAAGVDDLAFGRALTLDQIDDGWKAVLEGLVNFSRRGLRPALRKVLERASAYQVETEKKILAQTASPEFDAMLDQAMDRLNQPTPSPSASTGDVSNSPDSSASSPATIPLRR